ncbi:MAG: hypothetical protein HY913_09080 [Desulfomonile tiedjei]|nr:hypothetical protein [Desulfomonile tiedjei]
MREVKGLLSAVFLAVYLCFSGPAAQAWEFQLEGAFSWTHEWYSQQGTKGFLGLYNVDNGVGTRAGNLNFWNGGQFDTNITTGAKANWSYFNVEFLPKIRINEAIRLSAKYRLGTFNDFNAPDYHTYESPGVNRAFSEGQWTMFWATAQLPIGILAIGKRPWSFGTGLQYDGEDAATTESMALVAPFGPLDIGIAYSPYRFVGTSSIASIRSAANSTFVLFGGDDYFNLPIYPLTVPLTVANGQYFSRADSSGTFSKDFLLFMTYSQGPITAGVLGSYGGYHIGPEALLIDPLNPPVFPLVAQDSEIFHGTAFFKYNNGRFFLNSEAAWAYWTDRWSGDLNPAVVFQPPGGFIPNPSYVEQWRYMIEMGVISGPAKLSLLLSRLPGPDRRAGIIIGKQPALFVRHPLYDNHLGNFDVFRPYSYMLGYNYGGGLNAYNLNGNGFLRDAFVLAARLDYAVASNLNLFGTFTYANRTSNGYSWGCIGPNAGLGSFSLVPDGNLNFNFNRYPASPNIPDTSLGYEIDAGLDWKLLEGCTAGGLVAYWQPGKWFNYACVDRSVPGWETGVAGNFFGTRPDRRIDPVLGGQFNLRFSF